MATYFKDDMLFKNTNDESIMDVAKDIAKIFITKGVNEGTITDVNAATACYVEFYNQAMQSLVVQREKEKQKELETSQNLNFR